MRRRSKVLKCGSSQVWVTVQKPPSVSSVPLCETLDTANELNQYVGRTVPSSQSIIGASPTDIAVTADGRLVYSWDARNQLACAETRDDLPVEAPRCRVEHTYDYRGRRIPKEVFDANSWKLKTVNFLYDKGWDPFSNDEREGDYPAASGYGNPLFVITIEFNYCVEPSVYKVTPDPEIGPGPRRKTERRNLAC